MKKPSRTRSEAEIQRRIASDPDAPEATDEQLAQAKPFKEVFPKRVWAWGMKGTNGLVHTITMKESIANEWRSYNKHVVELVEND